MSGQHPTTPEEPKPTIKNYILGLCLLISGATLATIAAVAVGIKWVSEVYDPTDVKGRGWLLFVPGFLWFTEVFLAYVTQGALPKVFSIMFPGSLLVLLVCPLELLGVLEPLVFAELAWRVKHGLVLRESLVELNEV